MIVTITSLFGFVCLCFILLVGCSRYLIAVCIRLLQRQGHRLEALRPACSAFASEYSRSLEFQRLQNRVMGE